MFVYPDAEGLLVSYLNAELDASVSTQFREGRHVRVSRVGGPEHNAVNDAPMLLFECWDAGSVDASALARMARALVKASPVNVREVAGCREVSGPQFYPDPDTNNPRYQFTSQLFIKGSTL